MPSSPASMNLRPNFSAPAVQGYVALDDAVNAAEQKNNLSVTLLKLGRPQEALDARTRNRRGVRGDPRCRGAKGWR